MSLLKLSKAAEEFHRLCEDRQVPLWFRQQYMKISICGDNIWYSVFTATKEYKFTEPRQSVQAAEMIRSVCEAPENGYKLIDFLEAHGHT